MMYEAAVNGTAVPTDYTGSIKDGMVQLTELNTAVAAEGTQAKLDEVKAQFEAGTLNVFDTSKFTVKGETLTSYMADVDSDDKFTPDTEVVANGVFQESKFRSAPYFDIIIDGVTNLNTNFG